MIDDESDNRPFFKALVYTRSGDLDLGWALLLGFAIVAILVVLWTIIISPASIPVQLAALSFLGAAFISVLIAAIPIAKARLLANSKLPAEVAKSIASAGQVVETSTDVREIYMKKQQITDEIG